MARANCPTTEQLCELFAQIVAGRVTGKDLQFFLENPNFWKPQAGMSLKEARQIQDLIVIGPKEIGDLFDIKSIPNPPLAISQEQLEAKIAKRGNKLGLILRLKKIGQHKNDLLFLNSQFGKEGKIKKGLLYSNWYVGDEEAAFAHQSVCQIEAKWVLADLELPEWSFRLNYEDEQKEGAAKRGLRLKTVSSDVYDLLLVAAVTGGRYRRVAWGRTIDIYKGWPVVVGNSLHSLKVYYYPPCPHPKWFGLATEEVVS